MSFSISTILLCQMLAGLHRVGAVHGPGGAETRPTLRTWPSGRVVAYYQYYIVVLGVVACRVQSWNQHARTVSYSDI